MEPRRTRQSGLVKPGGSSLATIVTCDLLPCGALVQNDSSGPRRAAFDASIDHPTPGAEVCQAGGVSAVKRSAITCSIVATALALAACSPSPAGAPAAPATTPAPASAAPANAPAAVSTDGTVAGVVAETMNSGGYTYARLAAGGAETWIAGTEFSLAVGDTVTATVDMPMERFHSRTLNRDFPIIYFVRDVVRNGQAASASASSAGPSAPAMMGSHGTASAPDPTPATYAAVLIAPVPAAPGGMTVADVWTRRATLSGKPVVIRGQIVKVNYDILGANWYHLQDGSGVVANGTHDLVVTSRAQVKTGDVVTVAGVLTTGKDFGAGYAYDAVIEQADIRK